LQEDSALKHALIHEVSVLCAITDISYLLQNGLVSILFIRGFFP